jgi:putative two-component system response regulator
MFNPDSSQKELFDAAWRMAYIAEFREGNNTAHLERIRGYAQVLVRGLGFTNREVQTISIACQLHDIGKVAIPDTILLKTGDYNPSDWELIKRHTIIGAEILHGSPSPILQTGESIALTHHERWDGSGYPRGLKGENIPLGGRICAIADVFDSLSTPRSYKREITVEDARHLIIDASGQLFDPRLVEIFDDDFDDILRVNKITTGKN